MKNAKTKFLITQGLKLMAFGILTFPCWLDEWNRDCMFSARLDLLMILIRCIWNYKRDRKGDT